MAPSISVKTSGLSITSSKPLSSNPPKVLSREPDRPKYSQNTFQHVALSQPSFSSSKPPPSLQNPIPPTLASEIVQTRSGEPEPKPVSFYEKCFNMEYLNKSHSREFGDFLASLKDQMHVARYLCQNRHKPIDPSKTVRLKRDFKSSLV